MNFSTVTKVLLRLSSLIFLNYVAETMILLVLEVGCSPIPRGRSSPLEHNPFIILFRDGLKAAMRVEYCVLHSQVAFVVQDATCAINHPTRVVRVNVKGQIPQSSSQATAEAA